MIEVEVHHLLRQFLRSHKPPIWPHHLTMARLVARALRLGRSALIQTGYPAISRSRYQLSYLLPALLGSAPTVIVAPAPLQTHLLSQEIPHLCQALNLNHFMSPEYLQQGETWPDGFQGLLLTTPQAWLADRFTYQGKFPQDIPTIIDVADDLELWSREQLTRCLVPGDWSDWIAATPGAGTDIEQVQRQLTHLLFAHPVNPYQCCLIDTSEQEILTPFLVTFGSQLPAPWQAFWTQWQQPEQLKWATLHPDQEEFTLHCGPIDLATPLTSVWAQQPIVLVGSILDVGTQAPIYRQNLGLGELTCVKFSPDRHHNLIQVYIPDGMPLPNTPEFATRLWQEIRTLLYMRASIPGLTVLLVNDVPLKTKIGAMLAGEFGSKVQVEKLGVSASGILITGWDFWRHYQGQLPAPDLFIISTLPLPSLEDPRVAGRVAYYKQHQINWFNQYLLPTALNILQRSVAPVRDTQGVVALLDSRIIHRSYGPQVLAALSPHARIDYLDTLWLTR